MRKSGAALPRKISLLSTKSCWRGLRVRAPRRKLVLFPKETPCKDMDNDSARRAGRAGHHWIDRRSFFLPERPEMKRLLFAHLGLPVAHSFHRRRSFSFSCLSA